MAGGDYQLSKASAVDVREIIRYTRKRHGKSQVFKYVDHLENCTKELAGERGIYKTLLSIHPDLWFIHCQHHYIFGIVRKSKPIRIVAVLHERMDLMTRLKKRL